MVKYTHKQKISDFISSIWFQLNFCIKTHTHFKFHMHRIDTAGLTINLVFVWLPNSVSEFDDDESLVKNIVNLSIYTDIQISCSIFHTNPCYGSWPTFSFTAWDSWPALPVISLCPSYLPKSPQCTWNFLLSSLYWSTLKQVDREIFLKWAALGQSVLCGAASRDCASEHLCAVVL